jgi:serine/threonine protein kinase/tetratricopeptide (TPR) repeat protein
MIGETLAHYKILEKIGEGGMGEVYVAEDTKLKRQVALKLLPEAMAADSERLQRFQREAEAIAALNHPNIVTIYSVEEDQGHHFLTMELVKGVDLADRIPAQGMTLEQIFTVAIPAAEALAAAHEQGVVHRDLKPANIMVGDSDRVKILDFGLAKLAAGMVGEGSTTQMATDSITQEGRILGTVSYMSPEQAEGKAIDGRSDIFSLGVVLYQMATGEQPFKGDTNLSTLSSILKDDPDSVTDLRTNLPRHLGRIIAHCLEKDPKRRYQSAQDVVNELAALKREIASGKTPSETSLPAMEATKSRPTWLPFAIAAGLLLAAIVGWLALRSDEVSSPDSSEAESSSSEAPAAAPTATVRPGTPKTDDRTMAVVLPFENLGAPEDAYFAAGITDEITNRLSSVGKLGVISRQSAKRYADTTKNAKEIGEELGVDYILGGTVRWAQDADGQSRIRISPQLVRVEDDTQVWSETYDQVIDDIFTVQTEIAESVVAELGVNLLDDERQTLTSAPTENTEAYQAYLKGIEVWSDIANNDRWNAAAKLLERALELDPDFARAWAELSRVKSNHYFNSGTEPNLLADSKRALDRAIELAPDDVRVRLAEGFYHYYGFHDYERGLQIFEDVAKDFPNEMEVIEAIAWIYRRQGRFEEFIDQIQRALQLDPKDLSKNLELANAYGALRRFDEAHEAIDRTIALAPDRANLYERKASFLVKETGSTRKAREVLTKAPVAESMAGTWVNLEYLDRNFERALELVESMPTSTPLEKLNARTNRGWILLALSRDEEARTELEGAARELETMIASRPDAFHDWLAWIYALLGRKDDAIREAERAIEDSAVDRYLGPSDEESLAWILAMTGEYDRALEIFDRLLATPYINPVTVAELRTDPDLDGLRQHPDFDEMLAKHH